MAGRETLEQTVLSALLQGSLEPLGVADGVRPEDFTPGPHRAIATAIFKLLDGQWEQRDRVAAVAAWLERGGQLAEVGGVAELAVLAARGAPERAVRHATEELLRRVDLDRLAQAATQVAAAAAAGGNPEKVWLAAEEALFEAIPRTARWEAPARARKLLYPAFERIERAQARLRGELPAPPLLFPFGIEEVDERLGGLAGPELTLVLAPHGWSRALALQAALAAATGGGRPVILASDDPPHEFLSRAVAWLARTGDPLRARGELKASIMRRNVKAIGMLYELPLTYLEQPTAIRVAKALRARVDVQQPGLLVIDEVRRLGRSYRGALLRLIQAGRADGSRLLAAMETGPETAALDPFFPDPGTRRVAALATRIVRFQPGPPRAGTLRVLDRQLGIELSVRVRIAGPALRISGIGASGRR